MMLKLNIFKYSLLASVGLPMCVAAVHASESSQQFSPPSQVSMYFKSESYSHILPIKQLVEDEWHTKPKDDADLAFSQNELGSEILINNWSINPAYRVDYFVRTNPDTAAAFYADRTDLPFEKTQTYNLSLALRENRAKGLRLGYQWQNEHFFSHIKLGYWAVVGARDSRLNGTLTQNSAGELQGTGQLTEHYTDNNFLKRPNVKGERWNDSGTGYTVDIALAWRVTPALLLRLDAQDLYSRFSLDDAGLSDGLVDTDNQYTRASGITGFKPLYSGIETSASHDYQLPKRVKLEAAYQFDKVAMHTQLRYIASQAFYLLGASVSLAEDSRLTLLIDIERATPHLILDTKWLDVTLALDKLATKSAYQFALGATFSYSF
ncbi:hypothetical protein [Paraglaciecola chathamensis]|uniref:hypothetical protein n=1 Tax=Paraglaciecola chathamensis TaxID=368405 RepID=UPI002708B4DC|nr:hypothetical protein [Paraglaciecola chathamensis]MDO6559120.1 hypothetical protein [Paraglaciecola chathamensis]